MLVQPDDLERTFDFEAQCYGEIPRLTYQKQYRFEVCALNAAGYGPMSERSEALEMPVPVPAAPSRAFVRRPTHHTILVQWQHPPPSAFPVETFRIRYTSDTERFLPENTTEIHDIPAKLSSYTVINLDHGRTYFFQVSAVSRVGQGGWSEVSQAIRTLEGDVPHQIQGLRITSRYNSFITLAWNPVVDNGFPVNETRIRCSQQEDMSHPVELPRVPAATQCPVKHLQKNKVYYFQVAAVNKLGSGQWSDPLRVDVPGMSKAIRDEGAQDTSQ